LIEFESLGVLFPVVIAREGVWYVAMCPTLDIGTQGRTEKEAKEMIADLISEYLKDPDTRKPSVKDLESVSLTNVVVKLPRRAFHGKTSTVAAT
jgi:predicted RNase H-like HicB family nuclease